MLLRNIDLVLRVVVCRTELRIVIDKVKYTTPERVLKYGFLPSLIKRFSDELETQRICTDIDRRLIRQIFLSNLDQSRVFKEIGIHDDMLRDGFNLLQIPAKMGEAIVKLTYNKRPPLEEGDFNLSIVSSNIVLHFMTFSFCSDGFRDITSPVIFVGGNQGSRPETIVRRRLLVRDCFDISLEKILLLSLLGLGRRLGCSHLIGVSSLNHSKKLLDSNYNKLLPRLVRLYDEFWISNGARFFNKFYVMKVADDPIPTDVPVGEHKARKLKKREIMRNIIDMAEKSIEQAKYRL